MPESDCSMAPELVPAPAALPELPDVYGVMINNLRFQ